MAANKVILNGETLIDLTEDDVTASDVAQGVKFHLPSGEQGVGTYSLPTQEKTVSITQNGETVIEPDKGYALSKVTANVSVASSSKLPQVIDGTITTLTAEDLAGATRIRSQAFNGCGSLTSVTIPNSVTTIGNSAFNGCGSLTSVTIGNSVTSIGGYAFQNCKSLTSITIPDSVTSIGNSAFYVCTKLSSVTIGNSVTSIGSGAFEGCSQLKNITIPNSVTFIGSRALQIGIASTITMLPTTPPTISSSTFNAGYLNQIIVPAGCGDTYKSATNWSNFADYIVEATE